MADVDRPPAIITLTTDFGIGSRYVAAMKGVILSINPHANIVDISNAIPARDIRAGAITVAETACWFPKGTIHVVVVDPGVGSKRRIIYVEMCGQHFIGPDNGVLSRLAIQHRPTKMIHVEDRNNSIMGSPERNSVNLPVGEILFGNFNGYFSTTDFKEPALKNLNVYFRRGLFYGIAGKVGSGKSGILSAILEEVPYYSG